MKEPCACCLWEETLSDVSCESGAIMQVTYHPDGRDFAKKNFSLTTVVAVSGAMSFIKPVQFILP